MSAEPSLRGYLEEAATWDSERALQAQRSARRAWRVAVGASLCVVALAAAIAVMMPLKRIEPYLIRVDARTGAVDVVPPYRGADTFGTTIARYFLMRYVSVCERFDYALAATDYQRCGAFNSSRLNAALYARWARGNPRSPLNTHRDGSSVGVRIQAVSFLGRALGGGRLAQVRFERIARQPGGAVRERRQWIATIDYRFTGAPAHAAARRWNPLGFEVTALELEREALGSAPPAPPRRGRP
ncbi:MAG: virB8 family protein [Steroidobacteraceae bacterium]